MKTTLNNKVVYLSKSDLSWDYQKKLDSGKKTNEDFSKLTHRDFNPESVKTIKTSDVAIFTFGTDKVVIKTNL